MLEENLDGEDGDMPGEPARLKTEIDPRFMGEPKPYIPNGRKCPWGVWP